MEKQYACKDITTKASLLVLHNNELEIGYLDFELEACYEERPFHFSYNDLNWATGQSTKKSMSIDCNYNCRCTDKLNILDWNYLTIINDSVGNED